ncbi:hypothetical protein F5Y10DRAFT_242744 [Nemania abortiva]|nr:hypothetical protein F5Y10DRAFT_242744 [Nemania abortiva]
MHAEMEFQKLQVIHRQAQRSRLNHRHEAGWIAHVYLQLIDHVFEGVGQYENIQGATMEGDSIPFKKYRRNLGRGVPDGLDTSSEFCVSVSESSASSANSVPRGNKDPRKLAHIQSRGGVKIVDFALLLDVQKNSALPDTIDSLIRTVCRDGRYHLNQTAYEPIASRLIAVSIRVEEPFSGVDPLPPLALWTAAWYKRMRALRRELFATKIASIKDENTRQELRKQEQQKNLITVPVITVVGHQWEIYYAFFDAESITIYGPVELGSTCSLLDLYALVASLRTIKEWIQTTFREAMGEWFMVEANTADA